MKGNIFIKRPVMALSISILILIVGFISLGTLPVEQYPDIAPPTVRVEATYTGANADAVMNSVIMPLEESINGVENMIYITSTATNSGSAEIPGGWVRWYERNLDDGSLQPSLPSKTS